MNLINIINIKQLNQFLAVLLLAAFTLEGVSMSFFSKAEEEVVLFSEMKGHITFNGEPVKSVKIERDIKWKDDVGEKDYIETDEKGYFLLKELKANAKLSPLSQFVVSQELTVFYGSERFIIWSMGKLSKEQFGELGGIPVNLRCDLNDEQVRVEIDNGLLGTSCKWDSIK